MANNPYAPEFMNPNASRAGLWDMRLMSAANRMETPFEHAGHAYHRPMAEGGLTGNLGAMAGEPDYSRFTFDPAAHQAASQFLSHYGLAPLEASQVKQNTFLPNTGFFGNHPRLSSALEGAAYGAMAAHGGNTPGESIQGALEGMVGGKRIRQGLYNQQFARPFEAAGMMEGLEDAAQRRELQAADIEHLRAVNEHLKNGDDVKAQQLMEKDRHDEAVEANNQAKLEATAPRNLGGGLYGVYDPDRQYNAPGTRWSGQWAIQENPEAKLGRQGLSQAGMIKGFTTEPDPKNPGKTRRRYVELAPNSVLPPGFQPMQETYNVKETDKHEDKATNNREKYLAQKRKPSELLNMGYKGDMTDGKAQQQFLGKFYDQFIAPNVPEDQNTRDYTQLGNGR